MISENEAVLLLRGWGEAKSRLRVVVESPFVTFAAFCSVHKADRGSITFWIGPKKDNNMVNFPLFDLKFEFADVPLEQSKLSIGAIVESGIVAARAYFRLAVMLLK